MGNVCRQAGFRAAIFSMLLVASCSTPRRIPPEELPPPQYPQGPVYDLVPSAPINSDISSEEAIWHLRAALNVAALNCGTKGHVPVEGGYNAMLTAHKDILGEAYAAETGRFGEGRAAMQEVDRHQTRLYNFFANIRSLAKFCETAHDITERVNAMPSTELALAARHFLAKLEQPLRRSSGDPGAANGEGSGGAVEVHE